MNKTQLTERIRGRRLQRIRDQHFRKNPLCVRCMGIGRARLATQLDHVIALVNGGADADINRQGLCDECHTDKTADDMGYRRKHQVSASGLPTDPSHDWNKP